MGSEDAIDRPGTPLTANKTGHETSRFARFIAIWAIVRVPLLLLVLFLSRDWILANLVNPFYLTHRIIEIAGTPVARVICFLVFAVSLALVWAAALRMGEWRGYWFTMAVTSVGLLLLFTTAGTPRKLALLIIPVLAANLMPDRLFAWFLPGRRLENRFMALGAGVAELLFFRRYLAWVKELWTGRRAAFTNRLVGALPAILLVSGMTAMLLRSPYLTDIEHWLRLPEAARIVARGDFNWIEINTEKQQLFVTGHGVPRILRYDLKHMDQEPLKSQVDTGIAQAFGYDPVAGEIYVYNADNRSLLVLDADTLALRRSIPAPGVATGDSWIAVDRMTDTVTIVSEADLADGSAFLVLNRSTGEVRDRRDIDAGNLLLEPGKSRLFLSFFRRSNRLLTYDLNALSVTGEVPAPKHADRLGFLEDRNEVLLVAPAQSQIARFDAETLAPKGAIDAMFGVRALAVDTKRKLLLCGSLATGEVSIINLADFKELSRVYIGPWLRTIQVDSNRGVALISSNGALYELDYVNLL